MDCGPSTLEVLPEIVAAVRGRIPVLVDSGFRRGGDVFKALALGASAVGIGRANRFGLGAFGAPGVQRVLEIMMRDLAHIYRDLDYSSMTSERERFQHIAELVKGEVDPGWKKKQEKKDVDRQ